MVSREPLPGTGPAGEGGQEKAMTVRSVLLNRDSPDIESRLKRRRNRTQQVRFKDLVEGSVGWAASPPQGPNTPRASPPPRDPPEPAALCASHRSWPQAQLGSLTLPMPRKMCMSTAIQTSPSLQKPFPASQPRSKSVCNVAGDAVLPAAATVVGSTQCPGGGVPTSDSLPVHDGAAALTQRATVCHVPLPPPPRDPCCPYPGTAGYPPDRCTSPAQSCIPEPCPQTPACTQLRGKSRGGREAPPRPASVPCGQPWPPAEPQGLGRSDSERNLSRGHPLPLSQQKIPATGTHSPRQPAQGNPPRDPPPSQHQLCGTPWGGPCCTSPAPIPPVPGCHSSSATTAALQKIPAALSHLDPHGICSRLHPTEPGHRRTGLEGPWEPLLLTPQSPSVGTQPAGWTLEVPQHGQTCLTAEQSETLHHVQDLLQLVVVTTGPVGPSAGDKDTQTSQGEGPQGPGEQGHLQSQLQSLEGVLETSQQTIRVLLDVIQDLEKKEAQRDGRHSYRTGQDIANCGTCRDCACIIYSVEHDFRQQEGRFQQVLSHIEGDTAPSSPVAAAARTVLLPRQEPSPVMKPPTKLDAKKSRRKCFWFL